MSLFNIFKGKTAAANEATSHNVINGSEKLLNEVKKDDTTRDLPEIPEDVFVEYVKPKPKNIMEPTDEKQEFYNLQSLYRFLEQNLEKKGYEDALMNPDSSLMDEHIQFIHNELTLLISRINSYYAGYIKTIDFHIETRRRCGMIETVDELTTHRDTIVGEIAIVASIELDAKNNTGPSQNLILGYKKGFRNGFAAITYNTVFGKKN